MSNHLASEFNLELARKLDHGWRVVEGVQVTRVEPASMGVMYTCMIAKARDGTIQW